MHFSSTVSATGTALANGARHNAGSYRSVPLVLLVAVLSLNCNDKKEAWLDGGICIETQMQMPVAFSVPRDVLFVIDNSSSMADKASTLAETVARFSNILVNTEGGLDDIHIAVVATSPTDKPLGTFEATPTISGCALPTDSFLRDNIYASGERDRNYVGTLEEALACLATLPADGGAIEQPFEAMKRALDGSISGNAGFLRPDAFLLVAIITDEDDCSGGGAFAVTDDEGESAWRCHSDGVQCNESLSSDGMKSGCQATEAPQVLSTVASYVSFLKGLKPDPGAILVAAVSGSGLVEVLSSPAGKGLRSTCDNAVSATPSLRIEHFLSQFPSRHATTDICSDDWSDLLSMYANRLSYTSPNPCIEGNIDLDTDMPGIQHDCVVTEISNLGTDLQSEIVLPECSSDAPPEELLPCWQISASPLECSSTATTAAVQVKRGQAPPKRSLTIDLRCHAGC